MGGDRGGNGRNLVRFKEEDGDLGLRLKVLGKVAEVPGPPRGPGTSLLRPRP